MKKQVKKMSRAGKAVASKIKRPAKAATSMNAATTGAKVRDKAHKLMSRIRKAEHSAADVTMKVGSTMETIGDALVALVSSNDARPRRKPAKRTA
jgi:hypothetical protein